MQIEVVVPCIIVGFLAPIILFFVVRRIRAKRKQKQILNSEIYDKECTRSGIVEEGKIHPISLRRVCINGRQNFKSFEEAVTVQSKSQNWEFLFLYEDASKRRLRMLPNIQDISIDIGNHSKSESEDNGGIHKEEDNKQQQQQQLEPIPEEEEKLQEKSESEIHNIQDDNSQLLNNGDKSLDIMADISDIIPPNNKKTPNFQNKGVINFYENTSEDLSMLKEMMSQDGSSRNNLDQSQISQKQPQVLYKPSPFKGNGNNLSNLHDKSTDCIISICKDQQQPAMHHQHLKAFQRNDHVPGSCNIDNSRSNRKGRFSGGGGGGDESSVDVAAFDEKITSLEKQPYHKSCSKQQERTKKLFQSHLQRLQGFDVNEEDIEMEFEEDEEMGLSQDQLIEHILGSRK